MASAIHLERPDGTRRRLSGYRYAAPHPDAKRYAGADSHVEDLPPKVDLRGHLTPVEDQGDLSSCVANAVAGAYEYLVKRHRGEDYDTSRLFIYFNAREREGTAGEDNGAIIAEAIEGLREHGACGEEAWPYDPDMVNETPSEDAYAEASQFLVEDMQLVPCTLDDWRRVLAEGYPIVFGLSLFQSFDRHRKPGVVPMPSPRERARTEHGGHAMLCVGYSDPDRVFIVRNSWGADWGDRGYCYIPYDYLMNADLNDGDSWIIRQVDLLEVDDDTWGDDSALIGDLETELGAMTDDEFAALQDAVGDVHLETRLALLFLTAAGADGEVSDLELAGIAEYLGEALQVLGSPYDADKVLRQASKRLGDERLLQETVTILGEHLPATALASILSSLRDVVGNDDVAAEEDDFLAALVEAWQIEEGDEGDGEAEAEEGEGDDGEGEGEEEDEGEGDDEDDDSR